MFIIIIISFYHTPTWHITPNSAKLMYLIVYDTRDRGCETAPSPSPPSSHMHVQNSIGYRTPNCHITKSMYLSVYGSRDRDCGPSPYHPSRPPCLLTHEYTQVHLFSHTNLTYYAYLREIDVSECVWQESSIYTLSSPPPLPWRLPPLHLV